MENTYNYSKPAYLNFRKDNFQFSALFVAIVAITIPMGSAVNSAAIGVFCFFSLVLANYRQLEIKVYPIFPILIFGLMALSFCWTIDHERSLGGIVKSIPLFAIPFTFWLLPDFTLKSRELILRIFSYAMVGFGIFYLLRAFYRYIQTGDTSVFFYHDLVSLKVNAIYVSSFMALALVWFIAKKSPSTLEKVCIAFVVIVLILLSSKNITIIVALLLVGYFFISYRKKIRKRSFIVIASIVVAGAFLLGNKIKNRIEQELQTNVTENTINHQLSNSSGNVYNVSIRQAWSNPTFRENDFFPGAALRVYQFRICIEMMAEDGVFWTGYGVNATNQKIEQKRVHYNLYPAYGRDYNFHNGYVQLFAEVGVFGFLLLVLMLLYNLKNAVRTKDFVHISFAVVMISLFLTESFLSRQRGIVFFTVFYCLFNASAVRPSKK